MEIEQVILVVEDSDEDFSVLCWAFEKAEIKEPVERCRTAEATLAFLAPEGAPTPRPPACLMLLDLNLPDDDGAEVLRQARRMYSTAVLPIVVYSTASRAQTIVDCYRSGASSYVVKPLGLDAAESFAWALRAWWLETVQRLPK